MSPEEKGLLAAICDEPHADAPRLAYADWLEQQSAADPRVELIRLAVRNYGKTLLTITDVDQSVALMQERRRVQQLLAQHGPTWNQKLLAIADQCTFHRGLVGAVSLSAGAFVKHAGELFAQAPIVHVTLTEVSGQWDALSRCPQLGRVQALTLTRQGLTDKDVCKLAAIEGFEKLWYLDLSYNEIEIAGIEALAASDNFKQLTHTVLESNPGDVHERCSIEIAIADVRLPPAGQRLEDRIGRVPWLHFPEACWQTWPIDPCGPRLV